VGTRMPASMAVVTAKPKKASRRAPGRPSRRERAPAKPAPERSGGRDPKQCSELARTQVRRPCRGCSHRHRLGSPGRMRSTPVHQGGVGVG
jgi:hypothetical protein